MPLSPAARHAPLSHSDTITRGTALYAQPQVVALISASHATGCLPGCMGSFKNRIGLGMNAQGSQEAISFDEVDRTHIAHNVGAAG